MKRKLPLWFSIFTLCSFLILSALGSWQLDRLKWKEGILARIDQGVFIENARGKDFKPENEFAQAEVTGTFLYDKEIAIGIRIHDRNPGVHIFTPLLLSNNQAILVNRGWAPRHYPIGRISSDTFKDSVSGMIRSFPKPNAFTPLNDPETPRLYYQTDIETLRKELDLKFTPMVLYQYGESSRTYPDPSALTFEIVNDHFGYALFWYSMAFILVVIYAIKVFRAPNSN